MKAADDARGPPLTHEVTAAAGRKKTFCQKGQVEPEVGFGSRNQSNRPRRNLTIAMVISHDPDLELQHV